MTGNCEDRRQFLKAALAGAASVILAPGIVLIANAEAGSPATSQHRWGLLIDTTRCPQGCTKCVDACRTEQGWESHNLGAADPQWIRKVEATDNGTGTHLSLPVMCQHCDQPPCTDVCPTGASFKREDGIVLVDRHLCIGCRYCIMACPYKARSFVHETLEDQSPHTPRGKGTVEACTLCVHRIDAGQIPACVEACQSAGEAMIFGDLNDPNSALSQTLHQHNSARLRPDLKLGNSVFYQGL